MSSNSKLNDLQKYELREMKAGFGYEKGVIVQVDGVTVVLTRTGKNSGKFTASVASLDEKKIRRKVGEFHALTRWMNGNELPCRLASPEYTAVYGYTSDTEYLENVAQQLAEVLGG